MKVESGKYGGNLRFTFVRLISMGMACCFINSANATIQTLEFRASGGSLGDNSFHFHREETYAANGSFISANNTSDPSGTIIGQFKYDTAAMPADIPPSPGTHQYKTTGGPSWSNSALTASPASGLGTPSFEYLSDGTVATDFTFRASGFGGGQLRVTETAFSIPGPFGGTPSSLFYDLFAPGQFTSTLLTTQIIDGKEVPKAIDFTSVASRASLHIHQGLWTSNSDGSFTLATDDWSAPLTSLTITPIPEPQTYAMFLAGLSLLGFISRRKNLLQLDGRQTNLMF
jgi:hypothetical protein